MKQNIIRRLMLLIATVFMYYGANATDTYSISWNTGTYVVNIPVSSENETASDVSNAVTSHISSSGITWISLSEVEAGDSSEEWGLWFNISNNLSVSREASFAPWNFRIIQGGQDTSPMMTPQGGHVFTVYPGDIVSMTVYNLMQDTPVSLVRYPEGGGQGQTVDGFTLTAPGCSVNRALQEGSYTISPLNLHFTVRYHDVLSYFYSLYPAGASQTLSGDGEVKRLYIMSCHDEDNDTIEIECEEDTGFLQALFDRYNAGQDPSWDNTGMHIEAGYDDDDGAYIDILCSPNLSSTARQWDTGLKYYGTSGTLTFTQPGGGSLAGINASLYYNRVTVDPSQYGVTYTVTNGTSSVTATGTGDTMNISLYGAGLGNAYALYASYGLHEALIDTYLGENDIPSLEGTVESSGANSVKVKMFSDDAVWDGVTTYYDGLGYEKQEVRQQASGDGLSDIIRPLRLDHLRRDWRTCQPYSVEQGTPGGYRHGPFSEQAEWWYDQNVSDEGCETAYTTIRREAATCGRVLSESLPGYDYHDPAHSKRYGYYGNGLNEVRLLTVSSGGGVRWSGYYGGNTLSAIETTDGDGNRSVVWTDREGRTVSEQGWFEGPSGSPVLAETLYAYDDCGRLRWVISPEGTNLLAYGVTYDIASSLAAKYCYVYVYDSRNRLIEKRLPGAAAHYYVYDKGDRAVLFQDGNMRLAGKWKSTHYDASGHVIREDLRPGGSFTRAQIQAGFDGANHTHEVYTATTGVTLLRSYLYDAMPVPLDSRLGYQADTLTGTGANDRRKISPKGLLAYEKLNVLGTSSYARKAYYYDAEDNVIQSVTLYPDGSTLRTSTRYDRQGKVLATRDTRVDPYGAAVSLDNTFSYDRSGRPVGSTSNLRVPAGGALTTAARSSISFEYDGIGRRVGEQSGAVRTTLGYTQQGWEHTRRTSLGTQDLFKSRLYYDEDLGSTCDNSPSWTGNVSAWGWQHGALPQSTCCFTYDGLSRLTNTVQYSGGTVRNLYRENLSYDRNGNITSLQRNNGSASATVHSWTYDGNRRTAYSYDANGNITTTVPGDPEEFPVVTYNILNLPQAIDGIDDDHSVIRYLADGTKLSATAYEDGYVYAGPFRFYTNCESEIFESAASAGGRIVNPLAESGGADYKATYFITDHLGSTRAVVDSLGTVLQQNDFLPFGEKCSNNALTSGNNPYLYCGKELHETFFGIPWYDSGARWQTTDGIFASPDPLCEKYYSLSPYAYCAGNPVNIVDPDGTYLETAWDLVSLGMGVASFISNVKSRNVGSAIMDGIGIVADAAAVALPFVPGGVSAGIKATRGAAKGVDVAVDAAKGIDKGVDAAKAVDRVEDVGKAAQKAHSVSDKTRDAATIGQEAHRQIEAQEVAKYGARNEAKIDNIKAPNGYNISVRKDILYPDKTVGIIKPDTPSGHRSAAKREKLMQDNGFQTNTIFYNPTDPAYRPGSPTYIGPKK